MKVDKAVCTTDTMTDIESAISYENLLSTLVQKKILAIKRECEAKKVAKQRRKQQNCLGSLIFGSRHDRSNRCDDSKSVDEADAAVAVDMDPSTVDQHETEIVIDSKENMHKNDDNRATIISNILHDNQESINFTTTTATNTNMQTNCHIDVLNERGSCDKDNNTTQRHDPLHSDVHSENLNTKHNRRCTESDDDQNVHSVQSKMRHRSDNNVIEVDIESTSVAAAPISKCPSIVSQIELSDEINSKQKLRTRKNSCESISMSSSMKHTTLSEPADEMALLDHKQRYQMHLLEAKSISAQCSPILAQRQTFNGNAFFFLSLSFSFFIFFFSHRRFCC